MNISPAISSENCARENLLRERGGALRLKRDKLYNIICCAMRIARRLSFSLSRGRTRRLFLHARNASVIYGPHCAWPINCLIIRRAVLSWRSCYGALWLWTSDCMAVLLHSVCKSSVFFYPRDFRVHSYGNVYRIVHLRKYSPMINLTDVIELLMISV